MKDKTYWKQWRERNKERLREKDRARWHTRKKKVKVVVTPKVEAFPALVGERVVVSNPASPIIIRRCQHADKNGYPACESEDTYLFVVHDTKVYHCLKHRPY